MSEQDFQLDELGVVIQRQKEIGILIGDEIDAHVELLEEMNDNVDHTEGRLRVAERNLRKVGEQANSTCKICLQELLI